MKRFGRKRKAAAYKRIAELEYRLLMEGTRHLYNGDGEVIDGLVKHYSVTHEGGVYDRARISATLEMTPEGYATIHARATNQQKVRYQGNSFYVIGMSEGYPDRITVELESVA